MGCQCQTIADEKQEQQDFVQTENWPLHLQFLRPEKIESPIKLNSVITYIPKVQHSPRIHQSSREHKISLNSFQSSGNFSREDEDDDSEDLLENSLDNEPAVADEFQRFTTESQTIEPKFADQEIIITTEKDTDWASWYVQYLDNQIQIAARLK